jgi:hypothetical protein
MKIYKYYSPEKFYMYKNDILNGNAFFSRPSSFNDPADSNIIVEFKGGSQSEDILEELGIFDDSCLREVSRLHEISGFFDSHYWNVVSYYFKCSPKAKNEFHQRFIEEGSSAAIALKNLVHLGVFCGSSSPDNFLLWSHYANDHRGICIEYEVAPNFISKVHPVEYSNKKPPRIPYITPNEMAGKNDEILKMVQDCIYTKSDVWKTESEVRIQGKANEKAAILTPTFMYLGLKSSYCNKNFQSFISAALKNNLPVSYATEILGNYKIKFGRIIFDNAQ